MPFMTR